MALDSDTRAKVGEVLRVSRWLSVRSPAGLDLLLRHASLHRFRRHELVVRRGEPLEHVWLVLEGSLEVASASASGRRFIANYVPVGQALGLVALIDGHGAIHDTRAHVASVLVRLTKADLYAAMQADVDVLQSVLKLLAQRSRRLQVSLAEASTMPLAARLASTLLSLSATYGGFESDDGREIALRIAQDDLAAMVGVTRQRLNGEIKAMERKGLLKLAYARVILLDEAGLAAVAGDPGA